MYQNDTSHPRPQGGGGYPAGRQVPPKIFTGRRQRKSTPGGCTILATRRHIAQRGDWTKIAPLCGLATFEQAIGALHRMGKFVVVEGPDGLGKRLQQFQPSQML